MSTETKPDLVDLIIAYEGGQMNDAEAVSLFQKLVDNGMAWKSQGHYGRVATALLERGLIRKYT